jgi:hypothetical protein
MEEVSLLNFISIPVRKTLIIMLLNYAIEK